MLCMQCAQDGSHEAVHYVGLQCESCCDACRLQRPWPGATAFVAYRTERFLFAWQAQ